MQVKIQSVQEGNNITFWAFAEGLAGLGTTEEEAITSLKEAITKEKAIIKKEYVIDVEHFLTD